MKLYLYIVCFLSLFITPAVAQDVATETNFQEENLFLKQGHVRGFIWGLPSSIIKKEEKGILGEVGEDGTLFYLDTINGLKSSITYEFEEDKLYRARIFVEKQYTVPQERLEDLVKIKRDLVSRFGEPVDERFEWVDNRNRKHPDRWGWSVYGGDLTITIKWENEETLVTAYLGAPKKFNPVLAVTYEDARAKRRKRESKNMKSIKVLP